jgi:hypothetical protein
VQRPDQHEIDTAAQRLFERLLPDSWIARKQDPDYGIDYVVEVFEGGNSTGSKFDVQLKGTRRARIRGKTISFSLETEHVKYYLKLRAPVFLVVADVTTEEVAWVFLQRYVLEDLAASPWRTQKTVTVLLPTENRLDDTVALAAAAAEADRYMAGLHPAALAAAVHATRRQLESKDPRFAVNVRVDGEKIGYEFLAKETVRATFRFTGTEDALHQTLEELLGKGMPVEFAPGSISVDGLPVLQEAIATGGTLQWARRLPASLQLAALDDAGMEHGHMDALAGEFVGGVKETSFRGRLGESPLEVSFGMTAAPAPAIANVRLSFQIERWAGQPLLYLNHFDQLHSVFGEGAAVPQLVMRCYVRGNHLLTADAKRNESGILGPITSQSPAVGEETRHKPAPSPRCD